MNLKAKRSQVLVKSIKEGSNKNLTRKWDYDRSKFLNASDSGLCLRSLWYRHNDADYADPHNGYMNRGKMVERYIAEALKREVSDGGLPEGALFFDDEMGVLRKTSGSISGNPDFVYKSGGMYQKKTTVGEIKSIAADGWRKVVISGPKYEHLAQLETNMAIYKEKSGPKEDVFGMILYVDASDYDRIVEFSVDEIPYVEVDRIIGWLHARDKIIRSTCSVDEVPAEGKIQGSPYNCDLCEYIDKCPDPEGVGENLPTITLPDGKAGLIEDYAIMSASVAKSSETLKALRAEILDLFPQQRSDCLIKDFGYTAKRSIRRRSGSLDKVKLAEAGINVEEYYKPKIEYETLTVTKDKDKGKDNEH